MNHSFGPGRKSPPLARILSCIIPGLGHFYAGEYLAGIIWLILSLPVLIGLILLISWHVSWSTPGYWGYSRAKSRLTGIAIAIYLGLIYWCSREASRTVAEQNARKAAQQRFAAERKANEEFRKYLETPRKD